MRIGVKNGRRASDCCWRDDKEEDEKKGPFNFPFNVLVHRHCSLLLLLAADDALICPGMAFERRLRIFKRWTGSSGILKSPRGMGGLQRTAAYSFSTPRSFGQSASSSFPEFVIHLQRQAGWRPGKGSKRSWPISKRGKEIENSRVDACFSSFVSHPSSPLETRSSSSRK